MRAKIRFVPARVSLCALALCLAAILCSESIQCESGLKVSDPLTPTDAAAPFPESVLVLAYCCDLDRVQATQTVPKRHFYVDEHGAPDGYQGPRVRIDLADSIALSVSGMTLTRSDEVPNPIPMPQPDEGGAFVTAGDPASLAIATAFITATRVIDLVEDWVGHDVEWGSNGQLVVVACAVALDTPLN